MSDSSIARRSARRAAVAALTMVAASVLATGRVSAADWRKVAEGRTGFRVAPGLVWAADQRKAFLIGGFTSKGTACVMAFDPAANQWKAVSHERPDMKRPEHFNIPSRAAYATKGRAIYVLSWESDTGNWGELFRLDFGARTWRKVATGSALDGLSFCSMIYDKKRNRLVITGSDKREGNVGYTRTVFHDVASGKWSVLPLPPRDVVARHKRREALHGELSALVGRTRLAWFRDPKGAGTAAERRALAECAGRLAAGGEAASLRADLEAYGRQVGASDLLGALKRLKAAVRRFEDAMDALYPVPKSRRNSPLGYDPASDAAVLFGGDHLDYLMNDTWVLDLAGNAWRRARPASAPAPRGGHVFAYLPGRGKLAMYEGYTWQPRKTGLQTVWLLDVKAERWELAHARPWSKDLPRLGAYYGYAQQHFAAAPLTADDRDRLILAVPAIRSHGSLGDPRPSSTWVLELKGQRAPEKTARRLSRPRDIRRRRTGPYITDFCEVPDAPTPVDLTNLPANRWVKLPAPPRNSMRDRPRSWNTFLWDAKRRQILAWGGGHSVPSANSVAHYSPVSNRMVEAYDAEVPDRGVGMGYGAYGTTLYGRPWIPAHTYRLYAWEPVSGLMLFAYGRTMYFYDPVRMDWLATTRPVPYRANYNYTLSVTTARGVAVWSLVNRDPGLWTVDLSRGPDGMVVRRIKVSGGTLPANTVDRDGMTYDSKRDRLILHCVGDPKKRRDDRVLAVSLRDGKLRRLSAPPPELAAIRCVREMAYVEHADWVITNQPYDTAHESSGPGRLYRVYDCAADKWSLLDTGPGPTAMCVLQGLFYDARRRLVFLMNQSGTVWVLRIDPAKASLLTKPPPK